MGGLAITRIRRLPWAIWSSVDQGPEKILMPGAGKRAWKSLSMKFPRLLFLILCARPGFSQPTLPPVPDGRQSTEFSCGASALQAVLGYYGVDVREATLMGKLHSLPQEGTRPEAIERVART